MKKLILILVTLLALIVLIFSAWYFLLKDPTVPASDAFKDILPFGSGEGINIPPADITETPDSSFGVMDGRPVSSLFRVSETPIAGFIILPGSTTTVRYVDRATGHIHDAELATLARSRVTNTTMPKIYEAYFRNDGSKVLFRSLNNDDTVDNISITLEAPRAGDPNSLYTPSATILRGDIRELVAGAGDTLYYVLRDTQAIMAANFEGSGQRTILSSPFTSWRLSLYGNTLISWTKASAGVPGYAYTLNTSNGTQNKILGPLTGLTIAANPQGGGVAYSYNQNNQLKLFVKTTQGSTAYEIFPPTLAEKCVWGKRNPTLLICGVPSAVQQNEPDNWYKGVSRYSDVIQRFDTNTTESIVESNPKESTGVEIDVYQPQISSNDDYMVFINRNDLSLWALKLEE